MGQGRSGRSSATRVGDYSCEVYNIEFTEVNVSFMYNGNMANRGEIEHYF